MLVLFETPAGYALFKVKDGKLKSGDMSDIFKTPESANSMVRLFRWFVFAPCFSHEFLGETSKFPKVRRNCGRFERSHCRCGGKAQQVPGEVSPGGCC